MLPTTVSFAWGAFLTLASAFLASTPVQSAPAEFHGGSNFDHLTQVHPSISGDSTSATASSMPTGFADTTMMSGRSELTTPMQMVFLPDGRALILERTGTIFIADPSVPGFPMEVYMKTENTSNTDETGLLSIAIDPAWSTSCEQQHIYVFWTRQRSSAALQEGGYISRFTHAERSGGLTSTSHFSSEVVLWHDTDQFAAGYHWHYGGQLSWGPDEKIYLSLGDKYSEQFQRSSSHHAGCILRLNKDGSIPAGNLPSHVKPPACWSHGLRNGFRSTWDLQPAGKERMIVAETGGNDNDVSWEDIHVGSAGANYGWPFCEGRCDNPDFPQCTCELHDNPIHSYPHNGDGAALIGGVVYRGDQFPAEWRGAYFYADFVNWWIKALIFTEDGATQVKEVRTFHPTAREIISMAVDPDGNMWYTAFVLSGQGEIHKISYAEQRSNLPPTIVSTSATADGMDVRFVADVDDAESDAIGYEWHFGDGVTDANAAPTHTYASGGNYVATVLVTDSANNTVQSDSIAVAVGILPTPLILHPADGQLFSGGEDLVLLGSSSTTLAESFVWSFGFVHEAHVHPMGDDMDGAFQHFTTPSSGHSFEGKTGIRLTLTAVNSDGLSASSSIFIWPRKVPKVFSTIPSGLTINLDGNARQTPFTVETLIGFVHTVQFPSQCRGSQHFVAKAWNGKESDSSTIPLRASDKHETFVVEFEADNAVCAPALPDAGLVLRLDASNGVAVDAETQEVSAWSDLSWSQHTFHSREGTAPTLVDTSGGKAVRFDGVSNILESIEVAKLPLGHHGRTVFIVAEYKPTTGMGVFGWGADTGVSTAFDTSRFQIGSSSDTRTYAAEFGNGTAAEAQCNYEPGIEFQGFTIKSFKSSDQTGSECCKECGVTAGCSHFVHVFGSCWLKSSGKGRIPSPFGKSPIVAGTCRKTTHMDSQTSIGVVPKLHHSNFVVQTVTLANPYRGTQTVRQHINGKKDGIDTHLLTVNTASGKIRIGYDSATKKHAEVSIAEVLVYSTELNSIKQRDVEEYLYSKHLLVQKKSSGDALRPNGAKPARVCTTIEEFRHDSIACPPGTVIDQILFASFGNPTGACGDMQEGSCHGLGTRARLSMKCIGHSSCFIAVTNEALGNECPFTKERKVLKVEALCRPIAKAAGKLTDASTESEIKHPEPEISYTEGLFDVEEVQPDFEISAGNGDKDEEHNGEAAALDEQCTIEVGVDFYGNDVATKSAANVDECAALCRAEDRCLFFTLAWGNCYMKASDSGRNPNVPWVTSGSCKASKALRDHDCRFEIGIDYYQEMGALGHSVPSVVDCATMCNIDNACSHFTYAWGLCYLKQSDGGRQTSSKVISGSCVHTASSNVDNVRNSNGSAGSGKDADSYGSGEDDDSYTTTATTITTTSSTTVTSTATETTETSTSTTTTATAVTTATKTTSTSTFSTTTVSSSTRTDTTATVSSTTETDTTTSATDTTTTVSTTTVSSTTGTDTTATASSTTSTDTTTSFTDTTTTVSTTTVSSTTETTTTIALTKTRTVTSTSTTKPVCKRKDAWFCPAVKFHSLCSMPNKLGKRLAARCPQMCSTCVVGIPTD